MWKFQILKVFLNLIILAWTVLKFCQFSSLGVLRRGVLRRPILLYLCHCIDSSILLSVKPPSLFTLPHIGLWRPALQCGDNNSRSYAEGVTSVTSGASQGPHSFNSRSYAEDVTSVTSGASQGPHSFNSRSYAEDVTSVTSGASQGPHSFNLVFVCLFVCVTPGAIPYLSRTVPYHQTAGHIQLAAIFK